MNTELSEFERGLLEAVGDMKAGRAARVHSPEELSARRRGRPRLPAVKVPVKLRLDSDLLTVLRLSGAGWQTRINDALRREFITSSGSNAINAFFDDHRAETSHTELLLKRLSATTRMQPYYEIKHMEGAYVV